MSSVKFWFLAFLLLSLSTLTISDDTETADEVIEDPQLEEEPEYVVTLTEASFDEFVGKQARTLVEFYAPWCGHCKALAPKYEEAARILSTEKKSETVLAKVDATEAPDLAQRFDVKGYPTLVLIDGQQIISFDGGRETPQIVDWVLKHDVPAFTVMTLKEFEESKGAEVDIEQEPKRAFEIFGFVKKGSKRDRLFGSFAGELRGEKSISFYKIFTKKKDEYKIIMRRNDRKSFSDERLDGEFEVSYTGKLAPTKKSRKSVFTFNEYDIGSWMHEHRLPFFINLDELKAEDPNGPHPYSILYNSAKVPRGGIILIRIPEDDKDAVQKLKETLISTARELRANEGYIMVFSSKSNERIGFADDVNMLLLSKKVEKAPKLPKGYDPKQGDPNRNNPGSYFKETYQKQSGMEPKETLRELRYQYKGEVDKDVVKTFLKEALVDGKIERFLRSGAETETADDIYYEMMTANRFNEVVLDKNSDVLVLYCTNWGRYCQPFMEEYNKLAKHVQTYYKNKSIKIVYLDCDENDVDDIRVSAFPTLILYPGGSDKMEKGKILPTEMRTVDDIIDFIDEYAQSLDGKEEL